MQRNNGGNWLFHVPSRWGPVLGALSCGGFLSEWHCCGWTGPETHWGHSDGDRLLFLPPVPFSLGAFHLLLGKLSGPRAHASTWPARQWLRPPLPPRHGAEWGKLPPVIVSPSGAPWVTLELRVFTEFWGVSFSFSSGVRIACGFVPHYSILILKFSVFFF